MNPVLILEALTLIFLAWVLADQVVLPALNGRPLFPMFRRKAKLEQKLAAARETRDEKELERAIKAESKPKGSK